MAKSYKEIRRGYKIDIDNGECVCILSGLKIKNYKDLSLEHFVPKSRTSYNIATIEDNILPAYKIINSIKGGRLPCEWIAERYELLSHALKKNQLNKGQREVVEAALHNIPKYRMDPCSFCVLYNKCYNVTKTR